MLTTSSSAAVITQGAHGYSRFGFSPLGADVPQEDFDANWKLLRSRGVQGIETWTTRQIHDRARLEREAMDREAFERANHQNGIDDGGHDGPTVVQFRSNSNGAGHMGPIPGAVGQSSDGTLHQEGSAPQPYSDYGADQPEPEPELEVFNAGLDIEKPPPRGWLLANQFCREFLSSLVAPGATGKSALRYAQLLSLATGKPLTGEHIFVRCRVLLVSLEDSIREMRRRIWAPRIRFGLQPDELDGWLFYCAPKKMKLAQGDMSGPRIGALERALRKQIEAHKIDLVMLDPFVKAHGLEENNNGAMDFVCDLLASLAIEYDIAVDVPHHARKGTAEAGDADLGRGGSAIRDAARLVYTLTVMSGEEAQALGVPAEERKLYVRLDNAKVNLVPGSIPVAWFKLIGVPLGNPNETYLAGDTVQTVLPWKPTGKFDGLTSQLLNQILDEIDRGLSNGERYSKHHKAAEDKQAWKVVANRTDRNPEQSKAIIKAWLETGLLYEEDYTSANRHEAKGLYVNPSKRPSTFSCEI